MEISDEVRRLLTEQRGLATHAQLRDRGMSDGAVRWRLRHGWRLALPRVINTGGPLDGDRRLVAALLQTGGPALITGAAAAAWHGVTAAARERTVLVEVPFSRRPRSDGFVRILRTRHPEPRPWHRGPIILASRPRAVVQAARQASLRDHARAIVIEAVQRRIVRVEDLRHELELGPRAGSQKVRLALREAEAVAWSVPEADLARLVSRSAVLPEPRANPRLVAADGTGLPVPDLWFDDVGLAVQVHSRQFHQDGEDWEATVMQDGVFAEYGIPLVGVTPRAVEQQPDRVLHRIERAYRAACGTPRPDVLSSPG